MDPQPSKRKKEETVLKNIADEVATIQHSITGEWCSRTVVPCSQDKSSNCLLIINKQTTIYKKKPKDIVKDTKKNVTLPRKLISSKTH